MFASCMLFSMRIPTSFKLVNTTWTVERMSDEIAEAGSRDGDCDRTRTTIRIHVSSNSDPEDTFCHELGHALLAFTTKPNLAKNEKFVQSLGEVLCQFFNTEDGTFSKKVKKG